LIQQQRTPQMKNSYVLKTMTDHQINFAFQVGCMVDFPFFLELVDLFPDPFTGLPEFFVRDLFAFFGKPKQSEKVELGMLSLPHLKRHKRNQVTGEYTVDAMVFGNNSLAEHSRVLILALLIDGDFSAAYEVIPWVNNPPRRIQAVAFLI